MARLLRFAAVAVLVGGATAFLSGCTGDADPVVSLSPSVTAEVTPSPSPPVSVSPTPTALSDAELLELIPENARVESFIGATNFAKFFLLEYNRMFVEGDSQVFRALSLAGCDFCDRALADFESVWGAGGSATGGSLSFPDGDMEIAGGLEADGTWNVSLDIEIAEVTYLDADGNVISTVPPFLGRAGVALKREGDLWRVIGVGSEGA